MKKIKNQLIICSVLVLMVVSMINFGMVQVVENDFNGIKENYITVNEMESLFLYSV